MKMKTKMNVTVFVFGDNNCQLKVVFRERASEISNGIIQ